ncbi:MAG TPA: hypothetical protein ENF52_00975 [Chloroflexi bacterium]|nr:hypothetical protein [Chloroflexota bacterium]
MEKNKNIAQRLLDQPMLSRVRRNHALEHATMRVLAERNPHRRLIGRSSLWGFYVYGDVSTDSLFEAAQEGLRRLRAGQREMAIHPNCGSNLVVSGSLAGIGAFLALSGGFASAANATEDRPSRWSEWLARLPMACLAATIGLLLAQPLGPLFQAYVTTRPDVGGLQIVSVTREQRGRFMAHYVRTTG